MSNEQRVLSIGQCGLDEGNLGWLFQQHFGIATDHVDSLEEAEARLGDRGYALVLVNRLLDADGSPGTAVLSALLKEHPEIPMMLISDRPDAQAEAVRRGAQPGFGKAALNNETTLQRLRLVLEKPEASH